MKRLLLATKNLHKIREFSEILRDFEIISAFAENNITDDVEETGSTFEENAQIKAEYLSRFTDEIVMADDSGIEVEYLKNAPGIYSARYAGVNATDEENNKKLLTELKGVSNRNAKYVCVIALAQEGKTIKTFRGEVKGRIAFEPKGENGFGYDPIFLTGDGRTMAELCSEEKHEISHRKKAIELLKNYLETDREDCFLQKPQK